MKNSAPKLLRRKILTGSLATAILATLLARAATLTWDILPGTVGPGDGTITGGSGTWDTSSGLWTPDGGATNVTWNNGGNDIATFTQTGGVVTLGTAITAGGLVFDSDGYTITGNTLTVSGTAPTITVAPGLNATINSVLAGTSGVTIGGGGSLTLGAGNSLAGGTTINDGIVNFNYGGGAGTVRGLLNINSGATVNLVQVDALGYAAGVGVTTANVNGGTLNNSTNGNQSYSTNYVLTGGTVASTGGGSFNFDSGFGVSTKSSDTTSVFSAPILIRNGTLTFTTAAGTSPDGIDLNVTGVISSGGGNSIIKAGPGTMAISATTNYTGGTTINGGTLDLTGGGGPTGTIRGVATVNSGATLRLSTTDALGYQVQVTSLNVNGGTVNVNTTANQTFSSMALTMNGGTISGIAGSNIDLFNNGTSVTTTAAANSSVISVATLGLRQNDTAFNVADGAAAVDLLISSSLTDHGEGNHRLIKNGPGTLQLTGNNSYTGTTRINAGIFSLSGDATLKSPAITVVAGALLDVAGLNTGSFSPNFGQTLIVGRSSGSGVDVRGNLSSGSGTIDIAGLNVAGTLTLGGASAGNLVLNGGAVNFDLAATSTVGSGVNDLFNVNDLTLENTTNIAIIKISGALTTNTYTLFKYSGVLTGDATNLTLTGAAGGTTRQTFSLDTSSTPGSILLKVAGSSANLLWAGDSSNNVWDVVTTPNFLNGGVRDKFYDGDTVLFDDTGVSDQPVTIANDIAPTSLTFNNTTKDYLFLGASINGGTGLVKNGLGTVTLSNFNGFTGTVAINAGTVSVSSVGNAGSNTGIGAGNAVTLGDAANHGTLQVTDAGTVMPTNRSLTVLAGGGTLEIVDAASTVTQNGPIVLNGPLTKSGQGALNLASTISGAGSFTMTGGTVTATTYTNYTGDLNVLGGVYNTSLGGANGISTSLGAGLGSRKITIGVGAQMNWTSNNIFQGAGAAASNLPTVVLDGGTLSSTRFNVIGNVVLNSGAVLTQSATDSGGYEGYQFIGDVTVGGNAPSIIESTNDKANHLRGGGTTVFNVADASGNADADLILSARLRDGSGDYPGLGSLQKTGAGTLSLTAPNSYTGSTTVSGGTLKLTDTGTLASTVYNVASSATLDTAAVGGLAVGSGGAVNIASGGREIGAVSISSGATLTAGHSSGTMPDLTGDLTSSGNVVVGGMETAGTLQLGGSGSLLLLSGGTVSFDLDSTLTVGGGVNDLINAFDLNLSGLTNIAISRLNGTLVNGNYTLINYSGSLTGDVSNLTLLGITNTPGQSYSLSLSTPNALTLQVTGAANNLIWVGDGTANQWNHTAPNFSGSASSRFTDGDSVTFNDSGSHTPPVEITESVQPGSVLVSNATKDYTFTGAGSIDGTTSLVKSGAATLTVENDNGFTGNVVINSGTLSVPRLADVGVNSPLGAGTTVVLGDATHQATLRYSAQGSATSTNRGITLKTGGGALDVPDAGSNLTLTAPIVGDGGLAKSGLGTLTLAALNTFTGGTTVNGGTLALTYGGVVGALRGVVTINSGATLLSLTSDSLGYGADRATTININGGTLTQTTSNLSVWGMTVNLTGGTMQASQGARLDLGTDGNAANLPTVVNTFASPDASTLGGALINLRQANTVFTVADGAAPTDLIVSAPIIEGFVGAAVTKAGTGTMSLTGVSTYTGTTNVEAGTLLVTGSLTGTVAVKSGSTLAGTGRTGVLNIESGGIVAPGDPVGTLQALNLTMAAGSTLRLELNSTTLATGYDQLGITGSVDLTGATLSLSGTYLRSAAALNDIFYLVVNDDTDGITGQFANLSEGSVFQSANGQSFMVTYVADAETSSFTGGNDIAVIAVPEPSASLALCSSLGFLLGFRRNRRGR